MTSTLNTDQTQEGFILFLQKNRLSPGNLIKVHNSRRYGISSNTDLDRLAFTQDALLCLNFKLARIQATYTKDQIDLWTGVADILEGERRRTITFYHTNFRFMQEIILGCIAPAA
ncbi:MAG: hypothetical protein WC761_00070 [Candidatus Paceibacterota bacterium]